MVILDCIHNERHLFGFDYHDHEFKVTLSGEEHTFIVNCRLESNAHDTVVAHVKKQVKSGDTLESKTYCEFFEDKYWYQEFHDGEVSAFTTVEQAANAVKVSVRGGSVAYGWWSVPSKVSIEKLTEFFRSNGGPYYLGHGAYTYGMNYPTKRVFGSGTLPCQGLRQCTADDLINFYNKYRSFVKKMYIALEKPCNGKKLITSRVEVTNKKQLMEFVDLAKAIQSVVPDTGINFTRFEAYCPEF